MLSRQSCSQQLFFVFSDVWNELFSRLVLFWCLVLEQICYQASFKIIPTSDRLLNSRALISVPLLIFILVTDQLPGLHPLEILLSLTSAQQLVRVGGEPGSLKVAPLALLKIRSAIIFSFLLILPEILPAVMETIPVRIDLLYDIHIV